MPTEVRPTPIAGVLELVGQTFSDHRGAFLNAFRSLEPAFAQAWGDRAIAQVNLSRTEAVGAVRGLHLQAPPHSEAKLVRCLRGRVWMWRWTCGPVHSPAASGMPWSSLPGPPMPC